MVNLNTTFFSTANFQKLFWNSALDFPYLRARVPPRVWSSTLAFEQLTEEKITYMY
jgi:hypothetical protein